MRAGITEYVCPDNLGFTGVLKQRYTDFLVNEIGLDGEVVHLRSTEVQRREGKGNSHEKGKGGREAGKEGEEQVKEEDVGVVAEVEGAGPVTKIIEEGGDAATASAHVELALEKTESTTEQKDRQQEQVKVEAEEEVRRRLSGLIPKSTNAV